MSVKPSIHLLRSSYPIGDQIYYLNCIKRRLEELRQDNFDKGLFSLQTEALADEIDWLDCFVYSLERQTNPDI